MFSDEVRSKIARACNRGSEESQFCMDKTIEALKEDWAQILSVNMRRVTWQMASRREEAL